MYILTLSQKNQIVGQVYHDGMLFNPIQDASNNWVISPEEVEQCSNENFMWVKNLPQIVFNPKPVIFPV